MSLKPPILGTPSVGTSTDVFALDALVASSSSVGKRVQFVDPSAGSDSKNGQSSGKAKLTVMSALGDLPNGGTVLGMAGSYDEGGTWHLSGHSLRFVSTGMTFGNEYGIVRKNFNGDLIAWDKAGGCLENFILDNRGAYTGDMLKAISGDTSIDALNQHGKIFIRNGEITSGNGFPPERNVNFDGGLANYPNPVGIRTVFFDNVTFFGCTGPSGGTAGENIRLRQVVHLYFKACEMFQAPATGITQLLRILNGPNGALSGGGFPSCEDIGWIGGAIAGDVYSEAAGARQFLAVPISGNVTLSSTAKGHHIPFRIGGALADSGPDASNYVASPWIDATSLLLNNWANAGGGRPTARYRKIAPRQVALSGFVNRSPATPAGGETIVGPLPAAYRPLSPIRVVCEANSVVTVLEITAAGNVNWIAGGGTSMSLDGVTFPQD